MNFLFGNEHIGLIPGSSCRSSHGCPRSMYSLNIEFLADARSAIWISTDFHDAWPSDDGSTHLHVMHDRGLKINSSSFGNNHTRLGAKGGTIILDAVSALDQCGHCMLSSVAPPSRALSYIQHHRLERMGTFWPTTGQRRPSTIKMLTVRRSAPLCDQPGPNAPSLHTLARTIWTPGRQYLKPNSARECALVSVTAEPWVYARQDAYAERSHRPQKIASISQIGKSLACPCQTFQPCSFANCSHA